MAQVKAFSLGGIGAPCCCGGGGTNITLAYTGCNGLPVEGLPVNVYTNSSETTLVFGGTTDSLGQVSGTIPSTGNYWVDAQTGNTSSPIWSRFATLPIGSVTLTVGGTVPVSLGAPASGFFCAGCCGVPLNETLFLSDSMYGSATITNSGLFWGGNSDASPFVIPPCGGCPGITFPFAFSLQYAWTCSPSGDLLIFSGATIADPPFGFGCPGGDSPDEFQCPITPTSVTCLTPTQAFSYTGTLSLTAVCTNSAGNSNPGVIYCPDPPTFTVTE
jgi:hypothetical protein